MKMISERGRGQEALEILGNFIKFYRGKIISREKHTFRRGNK